MRRAFLQTALVAILMTTLSQSGCTAPKSEHLAQVNAGSLSTGEEQLIREVEEFSSSDETVSKSAWQRLQARDRPKLIKDLTGIANASAADDRKRVLIAFTFCSLGHDYDSNQRIVASALAKKPPYKGLLGDWAASLIRRLTVKGDYALLVLLFDASEWADGAMSTELAEAYSQTIAADPETFLRLLASRPEQTRRYVLPLLKDHSLTADEQTRVTTYLRQASHQSKLHNLANEVMKALTN